MGMWRLEKCLSIREQTSMLHLCLLLVTLLLPLLLTRDITDLFSCSWKGKRTKLCILNVLIFLTFLPKLKYSFVVSLQNIFIFRDAIVEVKNKKGNSPLWLAAHGMIICVLSYLYKIKGYHKRSIQLS